MAILLLLPGSSAATVVVSVSMYGNLPCVTQKSQAMLQLLLND